MAIVMAVVCGAQAACAPGANLRRSAQVRTQWMMFRTYTQEPPIQPSLQDLRGEGGEGKDRQIVSVVVWHCTEEWSEKSIA